MINFRKAKYVTSAPDLSFAPTDKYPEILFVGKSNVGKSSLLNAITNNHNLAKVSSTPGATKYLNYFLIDDKYYIIDAPGYGFTKERKTSFETMMDSIFNSDLLKGVIFILDSRRALTTEDKVFYNFLIDHKLPFVIVLSKADKITQKEKAQILKDIHQNFKIVQDEEIIFSSSSKNLNIDKIKSKCEIMYKKH